MIYTEENKTSFEKSHTHCWVCEDPFLIESYNQFTSLSNTKTRDLYKVRHHCHLTGEYIGACHSLWNLQLKYKNKAIPCFTHNFTRYDSHLILQGVKRKLKVKIVPTNSEHYMSVTINNQIKFLDSFQFLPNSLANLIAEIPRESLRILPQFFKEESIPLISRKGIFCYDYVVFKNLMKKDYLLLSIFIIN